MIFKYKKLGVKRVYNKFTWENTAKGYIDIIKRKSKSKEHSNGKDFNKFSIHPYFKNPKNNDKITLDKLKKIYFEGGE
ncbi:MAG: hypothetical protein FH753_18170 [Firmicutes bacterium]|nr:hypothetical protein [Bacillota bacterium]